MYRLEQKNKAYKLAESFINSEILNVAREVCQIASTEIRNEVVLKDVYVIWADQVRIAELKLYQSDKLGRFITLNPRLEYARFIDATEILDYLSKCAEPCFRDEKTKKLMILYRQTGQAGESIAVPSVDTENIIFIEVD